MRVRGITTLDFVHIGTMKNLELKGFVLNCFSFIKASIEYPSACWRDESGSPEVESKIFATSG